MVEIKFSKWSSRIKKQVRGPLSILIYFFAIMKKKVKNYTFKNLNFYAFFLQCFVLYFYFWIFCNFFQSLNL